MLIIHPIHRKLAEIVFMNIDRQGDLIIGNAELRLILQLLRQNLFLVRRLDELKQLAYVAHCAGDMDWEQDICQQIDELEVKCI